MQAIATALSVNVEWLVSGVGPRDLTTGAGEIEPAERRTELDPRYENLEAALDFLGDEIAPEVAAQARSTAFAAKKDFERGTWVDMLRQWQADFRRAEKTGLELDELPEEDDTPPAGRKKR